MEKKAYTLQVKLSFRRDGPTLQRLLEEIIARALRESKQNDGTEP